MHTDTYKQSSEKYMLKTKVWYFDKVTGKSASANTKHCFNSSNIFFYFTVQTVRVISQRIKHKLNFSKLRFMSYFSVKNGNIEI